MGVRVAVLMEAAGEAGAAGTANAAGQGAQEGAGATSAADLEREFSRLCGQSVCTALEESEHEALPFELDEDLASRLREANPDVAYIAAPGPRGQEGGVQELLEFLDIPFVGAPSSVCREAWDASSLPTTMASYRAVTGDEPIAAYPRSICLSREAFDGLGAAAALDLVEDRIPGAYPVAVKPASGGSQLGMLCVDDVDQLREAVGQALRLDDRVIIEQWVDGVELTVPVLGSGWDAYALPPVELSLQGESLEYHTPVRASSLSDDESEAQAIRAEIERAALEVYRAYGLCDLACIDLVWDGARASVYHINVAPSMVEGSPFPRALAAAGLTLPAVLNELVSLYA